MQGSGSGSGSMHRFLVVWPFMTMYTKKDIISHTSSRGTHFRSSLNSRYLSLGLILRSCWEPYSSGFKFVQEIFLVRSFWSD
jgi:hypothetical protein